jgi:hypothetical protein
MAGLKKKPALGGLKAITRRRIWLQGRDLNPQSSAYEADEMPFLYPAVELVPADGIEPPTRCLQGSRSSWLS